MTDTAALVARVTEATRAYDDAARYAAADRAKAVADLVTATGSQAAAARELGLDQSTVNKMLRRPSTTETALDLPRTVGRPIELRLPELGPQLRDWAAGVAATTADHDDRTLYADYISSTITGLGTALGRLAELAKAEGNRVAQELAAADKADPGLVENPDSRTLRLDEQRLAYFDLAYALREAADGIHARSERVATMLEPYGD